MSKEEAQGCVVDQAWKAPHQFGTFWLVNFSAGDNQWQTGGAKDNPYKSVEPGALTQRPSSFAQ